jgi:hypothetical protein
LRTTLKARSLQGLIRSVPSQSTQTTESSAVINAREQDIPFAIIIIQPRQLFANILCLDHKLVNHLALTKITLIESILPLVAQHLGA